MSITEGERELSIGEKGRKNVTEIWSIAYIAGYNQAMVDHGLMTQEHADMVLRKVSDE